MESSNEEGIFLTIDFSANSSAEPEIPDAHWALEIDPLYPPIKSYKSGPSFSSKLQYEISSFAIMAETPIGY